MSREIHEDPWGHLRQVTPARIALGRAGGSLPTHEVLNFSLAHAQARDAVHTPFDSRGTANVLRDLGFDTVEVTSDAADRALYLRRPDYGRQLSNASREALKARPTAPADLAIMVGDGLSSTAIHAQARPFLTALKPRLTDAGWSLGPVTIATGARVALGDEIAVLLQARAVLVLIGERPGLSSPDSLGLYLTYAPVIGRSDADRNCISNIRPEGLSYDLAAFKLAWLLDQAFARTVSGVSLKDESDLALIDGCPPCVS